MLRTKELASIRRALTLNAYNQVCGCSAQTNDQFWFVNFFRVFRSVCAHSSVNTTRTTGASSTNTKAFFHHQIHVYLCRARGCCCLICNALCRAVRACACFCRRSCAPALSWWPWPPSRPTCFPATSSTPRQHVGRELDAQTAFTSLALFGTIGHPFHVLPKVRSRYCSIRRCVEGTLR